MLSGYFENCYGIKMFDMKEIKFDKKNAAIIYAPNGVMKTSFTKTFSDIAEGKETKDELFPNQATTYNVTYYASTYNATVLNKQDNIYVIHSFDEKFTSANESFTTLLADADTRNKYDSILALFSSDVKKFIANLSSLSGVTKPKIFETLKSDFIMGKEEDWPNVFEKLQEIYNPYDNVEFLKDIKYSECINEKTRSVVESSDFSVLIEQYMDTLHELVMDNPILTKEFNDYHAEQLGKTFAKYNLFSAEHKILLKDGHTVVSSLTEWNNQVKTELDKLYANPELSKKFQALRKKLTDNMYAEKLCQIILEHREIIPYLKDWNKLKQMFWICNLKRLDVPFETYANQVARYSHEIKMLYETAEQQAERWKTVVDEFNRRFKVPFEVKIKNKANVLLRDEAPNITFEYYKSNDRTNGERAEYTKDTLMPHLSMGERRAMYLLYVLFDVERIKQQAVLGKHLIIADDIADSFDYKNKYAIIEYLSDMVENPNVDLLMLTHNFDFYRTVVLRIGIPRDNCKMAQRKEDGEIVLSDFKYRKDFFKKVIIDNIQKTSLSTSEKEKYVIASVPFYRNLCEYSLMEEKQKELTCFLHIKDDPINTETVTMEELWECLPSEFIKGFSCTFSDIRYIDRVEQIAKVICVEETDEVILENKIIMSIAIRLEAEKFLKGLLQYHGEILECNRVQTHEWSKRATKYMTDEQKAIIDEVNLMTAEGIHVNSFMYEPIIDMSDWALKDLYVRVAGLNGKLLF